MNINIKDRTMIKYAGIGARKDVPMPILQQCELIGMLLAARGFQLRSGCATGCDTAFEIGCDKVKGPKVYRVATNWQPALDHAANYHPNWEACDERARSLHARNSMIMLGDHFDDPVHFVVCWTKGGGIVGGTGQALRIAADPQYNIPVFNLFDDPGAAKLWAWIGAQGW
jgi:hypothetical protein